MGEKCIMQTQEKIKAITQKCAEANEDIMKLQFGCRIRAKCSEFFIAGFDCSKPFIVDRINGFPQILILDNEGEYKILGREIILSDVLMALGQDIAIVGQKDGGGCFLEYSFHPAHSEKGYWNFKHICWSLEKTLSDQPKETIDFLYNLLFQK